MDKLLLTIEEAAAVIGIKRSKMYQLVKDNEITCVHIGKSVRVPVSTLEAWVNAKVRPAKKTTQA